MAPSVYAHLNSTYRSITHIILAHLNLILFGNFDTASRFHISKRRVTHNGPGNIADCAILLHQYTISEDWISTSARSAGGECADVADRENRYQAEDAGCAGEDLDYAGAAESVENEVFQVLNATVKIALART